MQKGSLYSILHDETINRGNKSHKPVVKPTLEQRYVTFYVKRINVNEFHSSLRLLLDSARGMLYLHTLKPPIIHRDLKTQNILVPVSHCGRYSRNKFKFVNFVIEKVDEYWRGKLSDFGLSRTKAAETMSRLGTIQVRFVFLSIF